MQNAKFENVNKNEMTNYLSNTDKQQQADQELLKDVEMDVTQFELEPDFEEQLEAFPLLKRMWEQIKKRTENKE